MPALGEVVEHLGNAPWAHPGGRRELPRWELTALVELHQKLELGVTELASPQMGVAAAEAAEAAKDTPEGHPERCDLCLAGILPVGLHRGLLGDGGRTHGCLPLRPERLD